MVPAPVALPSVLSEGQLFPRRPGEDGTVSDDLEDAMDDLIEWLAAYPQYLGVYSRAGAWMAYRVALNMATARFTEPALHYFSVATELNPSAPDMRINYAVALHSLHREQEAIEQYEAALPLLDPVEDRHVFLLAATLLVRNGRRQRAMQVLSSIAACPPEGEDYWDLLAELEPPAPVLPEAQSKGTVRNRAEHSDEAGRICSACGGPVPPAASFCRYCGAALAPPAAYCPGCGYKVRADARFCSHCGGSLLPS
jgi:tetratricopeptide (TPR) repeat protein